MRKILFRGKRIDSGEWVYGYYVPVCFGRFPCKPAIVPESDGTWEPIEVKKETVGQYTGLTDKNGKKIFEGDIVKHESGATVFFHKVVFERRNGCAYFGAVMGEYETWGFCNSFPPTLVEIVGNIHDNPELLEVTE